MSKKTPHIIVSAPGKLILHGEHAVVFGKKALASSLNLRTFVRLSHKAEESAVCINFPDIGIEKEFLTENLMRGLDLPTCKNIQIPEDINAGLLSNLRKLTDVSDERCDTKHLAVISFLYLYSCISFNEGKLPGVNIEVKSNLPPSAGLGSSAAFSTCIAAALLLDRKLISTVESPDDLKTESTMSWTDGDLELINKWAFQSERIIHGNPSGIDNSVSTFGGALVFQKGKINPMSRLPKLRIILFNTKQSRSTKQLVASVRERYDKFSDILEPVMCSIEAITQKCIAVCEIDAPEHIKLATFQELIQMNQSLLDAIGVNHPKLRAICDIARRHHLSAKLTGAGGGGCAFALVPQDWSKESVQDCIQDAQNAGFDAWETSIGVQGVIQHISFNDSNYSNPFSA